MIRNAYRAFGSVAVIGIAGLLLYPHMAGANWPFWNAHAQETRSEAMLHDPTVKLLAAATNSDPNPAKTPSFLALSGDSALMSASGVDGTIPESTVGGGSISVYTVRDGDSLSGIAKLFGVSVNTILWANDLKSGKDIEPGASLVILPVSGVKYTVRKGDTVAAIARKYNAEADDIIAYNAIDDLVLSSGMELVVPGGYIEAPKAPTKKSVAKRNPSSSASKASAPSSRALPAISGIFGNPLPVGRISQGLHGKNAVDVSAPAGTPIYAAAGGTVIIARGSGYNGGYGTYVVIDHGSGIQTLYAHMSRLGVSGGSISKGQLVGYVGATGRVTGNHLHFEVRGARNPLVR